MKPYLNILYKINLNVVSIINGTFLGCLGQLCFPQEQISHTHLEWNLVNSGLVMEEGWPVLWLF
jgi:hypothetical protein